MIGTPCKCRCGWSGDDATITSRVCECCGADEPEQETGICPECERDTWWVPKCPACGDGCEWVYAREVTA
jgi:hypothetical protein